MNRRSQFANFLSYKVRELQFALTQVVDACDQSLLEFQAGRETSKGTSMLVLHGFSSIAAQLQTIKDNVAVLLDKRVAWSDLNSVRHVTFLKDARNAVTHDGNPVINLWADGKYFVATPFVRLDQNRQPIWVRPPTVDIRTISLEFVHDLGGCLIQLLEPVKSDSELALPAFGSDFITAAMQHPAIPAEAKRIFEESRPEALEVSDMQRIEKLQVELASLVSFCADRLQPQ
jgi:hypothetical protein